MTSLIDMGGHTTVVVQDRYPDGQTCFVAEHPNLPGCIAYAAKAEDAIEALKSARLAYLSSVEQHNEKGLAKVSRPGDVRATGIVTVAGRGTLQSA